MKYGTHVFLLNLVVRVTQPIVLENLISLFDSNESAPSTWNVCKYALVFVGLSVLQVALVQHANYGLSVVGMRLRIACSSLVYRKMTKLSCTSIRKVSSSLMVDLLEKDVAKFDHVFVHLHDAWIVPLQALAIVYLTWKRIGSATFVGIVFMIVTTIPFQSLFDTIVSKLRKTVTAMSNKRLLITNELINGIRTIKMYVWEKPLETLVSSLRRDEIGVVAMYSCLKGFSLSGVMFVNQTTLFVVLLAYVIQGKAIDATTIYVITYYYYYLRISLTCHFPEAIDFLNEAHDSINRIQKFLLLPEVNQKQFDQIDESIKGSVSIMNVSAKWSHKSIANSLHDIEIRIEPKKLYALVGPVASGKSSFLKLILGELPAINGEVSTSGTVSYANQDPWLFSESIRNNIIFGEVYDELRYRQVVRACALDEDFELLTHADRTVIGEVTLNNEQRTRISLARAIYRDADVYLLDDLISNFQPHVGKWLFEECINGILKDKTRIFVSNRVQYLKKADVIVFFNNGRIEFEGSFKEFVKNESVFKLLPSYKVSKNDSSETLTNDNSTAIQNTKNEEDEDEQPQETVEFVKRKAVGRSVCWRYFKASGTGLLILSTIACFAFAQTLLGGSTFWIAHCMEKKSNDTVTLELGDPQAVWILGSLTFFGFLVSLVANVLLMWMCLDANTKIHNDMLKRLLGASMRFFEANPVARIVDRFSKDVVVADDKLPVSVLQTVQWCSIVIGNVMLVLIVTWWMMIPLILVLCLYKKIKDVFMATTRNLKRLEAVAKTPILSHVTSSLPGLTTIRSCNAEPIIHQKFDSHQDNHTSAYFLMLASSVAFGFWIDVVSLLFVAFVTFSFAVTKNYTASYIGLAITQIIIMCDSMQSFMKNYGDCVEQMTAVERMFQLVEVEQEVNNQLEIEKPPIFWPSRADITFENVSLRYSEDDEPALKNVSFSVKAGTKVGVVGHTESGKSSLVSALFRLVDIEGSIFIDDIDIQKIDLVRLREKISVIPQNPVIFTTTVRRNLDAYNRFDDSLLWSALDAVELKPAISSLDIVLDRSGVCLSVGQRQLLCLARTILEGNRILVLDEATASVDVVNGETFKRVVRRHFKDCTVITVASGLNGVLDNDRVIVMDRGRLVEYDRPSVLLEKKDGYLVKMVEQTGREMMEELRRIAEQAGDEDRIGR